MYKIKLKPKIVNKAEGYRKIYTIRNGIAPHTNGGGGSRLCH